MFRPGEDADAKLRAIEMLIDGLDFFRVDILSIDDRDFLDKVVVPDNVIFEVLRIDNFLLGFYRFKDTLSVDGVK